MKNTATKILSRLLVFYALMLVCTCLPSCASQKTGCPATQSGMGAERVLSGEKVKKQKFKIKGMQ